MTYHKQIENPEILLQEKFIMMKNAIIKLSSIIVLVILFGCSPGVQSPQLEEKAVKNEYYVAAYVWPSCHDDSLGGKRVGRKGQGNGEVLKRGMPV